MGMPENASQQTLSSAPSQAQNSTDSIGRSKRRSNLALLQDAVKNGPYALDHQAIVANFGEDMYKSERFLRELKVAAGKGLLWTELFAEAQKQQVWRRSEGRTSTMREHEWAPIDLIGATKHILMNRPPPSGTAEDIIPPYLQADSNSEVDLPQLLATPAGGRCNREQEMSLTSVEEQAEPIENGDPNSDGMHCIRDDQANAQHERGLSSSLVGADESSARNNPDASHEQYERSGNESGTVLDGEHTTFDLSSDKIAINVDFPQRNNANDRDDDLASNDHAYQLSQNLPQSQLSPSIEHRRNEDPTETNLMAHFQAKSAASGHSSRKRQCSPSSALLYTRSFSQHSQPRDRPKTTSITPCPFHLKRIRLDISHEDMATPFTTPLDTAMEDITTTTTTTPPPRTATSSRHKAATPCTFQMQQHASPLSQARKSIQAFATARETRENAVSKLREMEKLYDVTMCSVDVETASFRIAKLKEKAEQLTQTHGNDEERLAMFLPRILIAIHNEEENQRALAAEMDVAKRDIESAAARVRDADIKVDEWKRKITVIKEELEATVCELAEALEGED